MEFLDTKKISKQSWSNSSNLVMDKSKMNWFLRFYLSFREQ